MSNVRVVQPPQPDDPPPTNPPPNCGRATGTATHCGTHHQVAPRVCCCGGDWPGTMTCHPCRNPNHNADHCTDGPEPPGGYHTGRRCNCVHKPAGNSIAKPGQARS